MRMVECDPEGMCRLEPKKGQESEQIGSGKMALVNQDPDIEIRFGKRVGAKKRKNYVPRKTGGGSKKSSKPKSTSKKGKTGKKSASSKKTSKKKA